MTLVLELPSDLEARLSGEAAREGLSLADYALRILESERIAINTGAELVAYWKSNGLIGSRPDIIDAPAHARALRKQAETRERT